MFPVSDVIPSRTTPVVTIGLIALNTAGFLYELRLDSGDLYAAVQRFGVTPAAFWWPSVLTSLFLHAGWLHFASNMLYLWIFGDNVEGSFGAGKFLIFYVGCGAAAAAAQVALHSSSYVPMLGASGAVAGVMGAYLVLYPHSRVLTAIVAVVYVDLIEIPALFFLGLWCLLQLFSGVGSLGVQVADGASAFRALAAGFVTGALCGAYSRFAAGSLREYWK